MSFELTTLDKLYKYSRSLMRKETTALDIIDARQQRNHFFQCILFWGLIFGAFSIPVLLHH